MTCRLIGTETERKLSEERVTGTRKESAKKATLRGRIMVQGLEDTGHVIRGKRQWAVIQLSLTGINIKYLTA